MSLSPSRAARVWLHLLVVVALIVLGVFSTFLSLASDPINLSGVMPDATALFALGSLLALVTIWWYRSKPLVPLIAGAIVVVALHGDPYLIAVGLPTWIARARSRQDKIVVAVAMALIVCAAVFHSLRVQRYPEADDRQFGIAIIWATTVATLALVTVIGLYLRQRSRTASAAREANAHAQRAEDLSDELQRQQVREDLAREVHDTLASRLSAISLQSGSLEDQADTAELGEAARNVRLNASRALADLRTLLASLREGGASASAPTADLLTDLDDLLDLFQDAEAAGLEVRPFIVLDGYAGAPDAVRRTVFRITQEALTNALRHSSDHRLEIKISGAPGKHVSLEFRNACDAQPTFTQGAGRGLEGLRERVELLGGTSAVTREDGYFVVRAMLPWEGTTL